MWNLKCVTFNILLVYCHKSGASSIVSALVDSGFALGIARIQIYD